MKKTFKYRIYSNRATITKAENWLNLCRRLYNAALEQRIAIYRQNKSSISCFGQINQLPDLKDGFSEYNEVGSQVLQEVLERLDKAYQGFFRRIKNGNGKAGFPRFKGKDRYNSFVLKQAGWKLDGKYLTITKVGKFKFRLSRLIEGDIKTVTIRRESTGKWYVCFSCDNVPEKKLPKLDRTIGLDVGIKSFCVDSDGNKIDNPQYFRQSEKLLRQRQRIFCRRAKGSHRRHKTRLLVAKTHEKIVNQRNYFLHKTANQYIANYGIIRVEDLNISGMVRNHHLAKSISDASWGKFFNLLSYKAEEAGRELIKVNPKNTSRKCSQCGIINQELKLSDRIWVCGVCGTVHDRDHNGAKNINADGQSVQELTYAVAQSVS